MPASPDRRNLNLVFVIDAIETLDAAHDTSVALMESAQARGHTVLVTTMSQLGVADARAIATCRPVRLKPATLHGDRWRVQRDWYTVGDSQRWVLDGTDAVFVRTDPPVDATYLRGTYILDLVDQTGTVMINAPAGLRHANEKLFALQFPELCPDTIVSADSAEILQATRSWGSAVIKPTDGMGGRGIMLLRPDDLNVHSIIEAATVRGSNQVVVQRFIPESADGDRRVMVLDGTPIGVVRRVAAGGEFRCNMATGATVLADAVTSKDHAICARIGDQLATHGMVFVGIDVIGDYLIEINVTSPTGVREIDAFAGTRMSEEVMAWVEQRGASTKRGADKHADLT